MRTLALVACFLFAQVALNNSQDVVTISGPPTCAQCVVDLVVEVTFADRPELGLPIVGGTQHIVRDSAGRILLTHNMFPSRIFEFAADGTFIRAIGSEGQAPGEFLLASQLILGEEGKLLVRGEFTGRICS